MAARAGNWTAAETLFRPYAANPDSISRTYACVPTIFPVMPGRIAMLDFVFLTLGLGGFALMAVYVLLCTKL